MGIFGFGKSKEKLREDGLAALESGNAKRGVELLEKAADQGDVEAMIALGRFHDGKYPGGQRWSEKALDWFSKAAHAGSAEAALLAGELLSDKEANVYSNRVAAVWFEEAAAMGNVEAMVRAGKMYLHGVPADQGGREPVYADTGKALKLLEEAAEAGNTEARFLCGETYFYGRGWPRDLAKGAEYLKQAAEDGDAEAQYDLGLAYQAGKGVPQDMDEAIRWLRQAAENKHLLARRELGRIYYEADGVAKDMDEAFRWYRLAAEHGDVDSWPRLGEMYHDGLGTEADHDKAIWWLKKADDEGLDVKDTLRRYLVEVNADKIAWMEKNTAAVEPSDPKTEKLMKEAATHLCMEWLEEGALSYAYYAWRDAAEAGNADAAFNCGLCCLLGLGTERSQDDAEAYFARAAELGDGEAAQNLAHEPLDFQTIPCHKLRLPSQERGWIFEDLRGKD